MLGTEHSGAEIRAAAEEVCEVAAGFSGVAKNSFADGVTQGTLKTIQGRIHDNVKWLRQRHEFRLL